MSNWYDLTNEQLEALPTHRLYEVYKRYQSSDAYYSYRSDVRGEHLETNIAATREFIKTVLDERGHIDRPKQSQISTKPLGERYYPSSFFDRDYSKPHVPKGPIKDAYDCIGKQVFKTSKKPFKSKNAYNTVSGLTVNPHTKLEAFEFEEDDSIVDVHVCDLRKVK